MPIVFLRMRLPVVAMDHVFERSPVGHLVRIAGRDAAEQYGVTYPAASRAILRLLSRGILREITGGNYGRIYACDRVYDIIASG